MEYSGLLVTPQYLHSTREHSLRVELGAISLRPGGFCCPGMFHGLVDIAIEERALLSDSDAVSHRRLLFVRVAERIGRSCEQCPADFRYTSYVLTGVCAEAEMGSDHICSVLVLKLLAWDRAPYAPADGCGVGP
jgi:hypothetical protein